MESALQGIDRDTKPGGCSWRAQLLDVTQQDDLALTRIERSKGVGELLGSLAPCHGIVGIRVLSLSPDKERVFGEIARVLRPGGRMLISDVVVDAPMAWMLRRLVKVAPSFAMARTERFYLDAMTRAGLVGVEVLDRLIYESTDLLGLFADGV